METILMSILISFTTGVASGITWDFMKSAGLLDSFKKKFVNKKDFKDDSTAEKFLKDITEKESSNTAKPLNDAKLWYEKRAGQKASKKFIKELVEWLEENKTQFADLGKKNGAINIDGINTSGHGTSVIQAFEGSTITGNITGIQNNKQP